MALSSTTELLIRAPYVLSKKLGLLKLPFVEKLFIAAYFLYKRHLEDPFYQLTRLYPQLFKNGHIIDVGANIGFTSSLFVQHCTEGYAVHAFEPSRDNFRLLNETNRAAIKRRKLLAHQRGVGAYQQTVSLRLNDHHHGDHRILTTAYKAQLASNDKAATHEIQIVSLDEYCRELSPVSFIKIDVQGYELEVCKGMTSVLANNPHCAIAFEVCERALNDLGFSTRELISFFINRSYVLFKLNNNGSLDQLSPSEESLIALEQCAYVDVIALKADNPLIDYVRARYV
jgi:FkbM family methyltransferase